VINFQDVGVYDIFISNFLFIYPNLIYTFYNYEILKTI
jgi:hypothetical protein